MITGEDDMLNRANALQDKLTAYRHDIHQHPEVGFQEFRTSARVAEVLNSLGCRVQAECRQDRRGGRNWPGHTDRSHPGGYGCPADAGGNRG